MDDRNRRVLLIESDQHKVDRLENLLKKGRYHLVCVPNSEEALAFVNQQQVDIIVMSLKSSQVTESGKILERLSEHPVVMLSTTDTNCDSLLKHGAQDILEWDTLEEENLERAFEYAIKRKKVLLELETTQFVVKKAILSKRYFLANLGHQIRTPVTSILGALELFPEHNLSEDQKQFLEVIKNAATSLSSLMPDIIDISRIDEGESFTFSMREIVLKEVFEQLKSSYFVSSLQSQIELRFFIDPSVPHRIIGDRERLTQVISHLISNALKVNAAGSEIEVTASLIDALPESPEVQFTITTPHQQPQGFDRGIGFGLLIAQKLVEFMGGTIKQGQNEKGQSIFHFTLPLMESQLAEPSEGAIALPESLHFLSAIEEPPRLRVLLVEDDRSNQIIIQKLLEKLGHSAVTASSGKVALDLVNSDVFDIVLMDIELPDIDGLEATKIIRKKDQELGQHTAIIAMTAHASSEYQEQCLALGMDDFLPKPISREDLEQAIFSVYERLVLQIRL